MTESADQEDAPSNGAPYGDLRLLKWELAERAGFPADDRGYSKNPVKKRHSRKGRRRFVTTPVYHHVGLKGRVSRTISKLFGAAGHSESIGCDCIRTIEGRRSIARMRRRQRQLVVLRRRPGRCPFVQAASVFGLGDLRGSRKAASTLR
jgi:hypothetical protein